MRNLKVLRNLKADLDLHIIGHCIDADSKKIFVLTEDLSVYDISDERVQKIEHNLNLTAIINKVKCDDIILVEYMVETGCILVVLRCGSFIKLAVSSFGQQSGRVYEHESEVSSVKVTPSQDLIALADSNNKLLILSPDLMNCLHKEDALLQNNSHHKPVGVGWGSKETQFFGLDGRPSKESGDKNKIVLTEDEIVKVDKIEASELFRKFKSEKKLNTVIDWRGDGQILASLTHIPETDKHYLKVWNRNLELQYMSEQLVTVERGLISWIPNGQYVCCAQRRDKRINEIAMFEKNGMVHQRITLPLILDDLYIKDIAWSNDSGVLAIMAVKFDICPIDSHSISKRHILLLYTMQNFHYYLKFCTHIGDTSQDKGHIYSLRWNPTNPTILYVWSSNGQCYEFECTPTVDYCYEGSLVAVQDSNRLLLTPFSVCNIPPPMCAAQVELPRIISRIIVNSRSPHSIRILTIDDSVYCPGTEESCSKISNFLPGQKVDELISSYSNLGPIHLENADQYQNLTILSSRSLLASRQRENSCELVELVAAENRFSEKVVHKIPVPRRIVSIIPYPYNSTSEKSEKICFITDDWVCKLLNIAGGVAEIKFDLRGLSTDRAQILDARFIAQSNSLNDDFKLITLSQDLTLRINEHVLISNSCTSFRITKNFLLYTTTENVLNIVPVKTVLSKVESKVLDHWSQPIEAGGTLVVASEHDSKVVLQMPRGNLETIHPRILVLLEIISHLDKRQNELALKLAKRHRVDTNFICDYLIRKGPLDSLSIRLLEFVEQIAQCDPTLLNIFITELSQDDTMNGRYKGAMDSLADLADWGIDRDSKIDDKVNLICRSFTWNGSDEELLQPRLLSLIRQDPRKADEALEIVYSLDQAKQKVALKFMLYFVSIDQLFFDALSTHNTDIALMVAGVSSKDPKQYLALLDNFNAIDQEHLRNYRIDLHIKNYQNAFLNALHHLKCMIENSEASDTVRKFIEEIIELVVSKRLFKHATQCCLQLKSSMNIDSYKLAETMFELFMMLWSNYGDYLLEKRHYLEAGLVYTDSIKYGSSDSAKLENFNSAVKCLMLEDDWERTFSLIQRHSEIIDNRAALLARLSDHLMLQGKVNESALVINANCNDILATTMIQKGRWHLAEAFVSHSLPLKEELFGQIIESIKDDVERVANATQEEFETAKTRFERLKELISMPNQPTRSNFPMLDADNCLLADSLSTVDGSELSSTISGSGIAMQKGGKVARSGAPSIRTKASCSSRSSKSNAERKKKIQLKQGSRYEDMAIVLELKKFVNKQKSLQEQARQLQATEIYFNGTLYPNDSSVPRLNDLVLKSYDLAKEICKQLWPRGVDAQEESMNSLYKRFIKRLEFEEMYEDVDFEVLIAPELPRMVSILEL